MDWNYINSATRHRQGKNSGEDRLETMKIVSKLRRVDWIVVSLVLILNAIGLINLLGVTIDSSRWMQQLFWRQLLWSLIGILLMFVVAGGSYKQIVRPAPLFYVLSVGLVVLPLLLGIRRKGAHSWLLFGNVSVQPAEFAKLALILMLARFLGTRSRQGKIALVDGIIALVIALIPAVIVALQPDLGSAVIFVSIAGILLFVAGLHKRWILAMIAVMIIGAALWYPHLKPYQQARISVFLHPWEDSLGKGYNVVQSEIAIGSGQISGKGFGQGSQTRYRFLPEHYTDFIFAGFIEQFGLIGGIVLLSLYGILFYRLYRLAVRAHDPDGLYLVAGVMALLSTHVILNIGMTMGLLPVTGLPLPWLSYGGSSLLTSFLGIGLALTSVRERYMFER